MRRRSAPPGTQAILRAIRILKVFSDTEAERTLYELSSTAGLTKTTTHRLLAAMESEGLVARGATQNTYRLGPAVIALGVQALRTNDLRASVRPHLIELAEKTGETATLEVLSDDRMLILDEISGRHLVSANAEIGTQWPVHATSTGKALLAALPEEQARQLLKPPLRRFTSATVTDPRILLHQLQQVRRDGCARAVEELEEGFVAVAAAFRGPLGDAVGAVSVGGPTSRIDRKQLGQLALLVKSTSGSISERLGFETGPAPLKAPASSLNRKKIP